MPAYPMKELCKRLPNANQPDENLLTDVYNAISVFYNYTGTVKCNSITAAPAGARHNGALQCVM